MRAKLKVKNFGPIDEAELDLRNVNVLIGPQSSGKSVLAKLYTICKTPDSFLGKEFLDLLYYVSKRNDGKQDLDVLRFEGALKDYNIHSFLNSKTIIEYDSEIHYFRYSGKKILFKRKFEKDINRLQYCIRNIDEHKAEAISIVDKYFRTLSLFKGLSLVDIYQKKYGEDFTKNQKRFDEFLYRFDIKEVEHGMLSSLLETLKYSENKLLSYKALYIPAERIIVSILRSSTWSLQSNEIPIPRHIINFGALYERACSEIKEVNLDFISKDFKYKKVQGIDRIFVSQRKSFLLTEAATGLQSVIPLLLPILEGKKNALFSNPSFVIEEPELNLYPKAQYELMKLLESSRRDTGNYDTTYIHTYTTHSPYILGSFNNMLYAYKVGRKYLNDEVKLNEVKSVLQETNWLNPDNFNAYVIKDGTVRQIFNRDLGLIDDNEIDDVTDCMNDDFDRLISI